MLEVIESILLQECGNILYPGRNESEAGYQKKAQKNKIEQGLQGARERQFEEIRR